MKERLIRVANAHISKTNLRIVFHLFKCLICRQVLNEIKTLNFKEKIMALAITDATLRK
jgi:hypothetical protein